MRTKRFENALKKDIDYGLVSLLQRLKTLHRDTVWEWHKRRNQILVSLYEVKSSRSRKSLTQYSSTKPPKHIKANKSRKF